MWQILHQQYSIHHLPATIKEVLVKTIRNALPFVILCLHLIWSCKVNMMLCSTARILIHLDWPVQSWINLHEDDSDPQSYLDSRCVDFELLEDGKSLFIEFAADGDVCDVWSIIVIETSDVFHDATAISLDGCQDQQVLEIPANR